MSTFGQRTAFLAAIAMAFAAMSAAAQTQEDDQLIVYKYVHCDVEYIIQEGDTLASISETAYGAPRSQLIFSRNSQVISMVEALPVGKSIIVPCVYEEVGYTPDEDALDEAQYAEEEETPTAPVPAPAPEQQARSLRFLSADGQPPFVDLEAPGGGLAVRIVNEAMRVSTGEGLKKISFVNDRSAHLSDLLDEGSFDIGFPWVKPPCEDTKLADVSPQAAWMCVAFAFSEPLYENIETVFVRADSAIRPTELVELQGRRICIATPEPPLRLLVADVTTETADFLVERDPVACLTHVRAGDADVAVIDPLHAELSGSDELLELTSLTSLVTVHAVAPQSKPDAVAALSDLNVGLDEIRDNGWWFRIVSRRLVQ